MAKPTSGASVPAVVSSVAWLAHALPRGGVAAAIIVTQRADLLTAVPPTSYGAIFGAICTSFASWTNASSIHMVTRSSSTCTRRQTVQPVCPCGAFLVAVFPVVSLWTLLETLPIGVVT